MAGQNNDGRNDLVCVSDCGAEGRVVWTPWNHDSQNLESFQERSIRNVITCEQRAADFDMRLITGT